MTKEQINSLRILNDEKKAEENRFKDLQKEHEKKLSHLEKERNAITKVCDHKYPNGRSAWHGMFMYSSCDICGLSDL